MPTQSFVEGSKKVLQIVRIVFIFLSRRLAFLYPQAPGGLAPGLRPHAPLCFPGSERAQGSCGPLCRVILVLDELILRI